MDETTAIVTSIAGSTGVIVTMLTVMTRSVNSQFRQMNTRIAPT